MSEHVITYVNDTHTHTHTHTYLHEPRVVREEMSPKMRPHQEDLALGWVRVGCVETNHRPCTRSVARVRVCMYVCVCVCVCV